MNATSQAVTIEITTKIAHLAVLFRAEFPNAQVDLKPWLEDYQTLCQLDPHSIDLNFYFPKRQAGLNCSCILMQVQFSKGLLLPTCQVSTIEACAFASVEPQWQFSTQDWQFMGQDLPDDENQERFQYLINRILELFHSTPVSTPFHLSY
ncbi:MAG: hypothetical protein ACFB0C_00305 [Leptolyngbyaceae cyanobacterium]